jgi:hypothetical protein
LYICSLLKVLSETPIKADTAQCYRFSALMVFHWYEPVIFKHYKSTSPNISVISESPEHFGRMIGTAAYKGFLVLELVILTVFARSYLRSGLDYTTPNLGTILAKMDLLQLQEKQYSPILSNYCAEGVYDEIIEYDTL